MPMYTEDFVIGSNWVDPFLDLSLPSLFRILQTVATNGAEAIGAGKAETTDKGYFWVLTRMGVEINRMPKFLERIKVHTYPGEQLGFFYFRHFYAEDERGGILFRVSSSWALLEEKTRMVVMRSPFPFPFPKESHEGQLPRPGKLRTPEDGYEASTERLITYSMCDLNGHLNNTRYLELIVDCKTKDFYKDHVPSSILINFEKEIMEQEKVDVCLREEGDASFSVAGKVGEEERFLAKLSFRKR